jgi:MOSC domain-containing protein YiiM
MKRVAEAEARANWGLWGDRHGRPDYKRQVLLIEKETLDQLDLEPSAVRENVTTEGIRLMGLPAGTRLRLGKALLEITMPCEPCQVMDEVRAGLRAQLEGRRGMLCRVLEGGSISVGDVARVEPPTPSAST